MKQSPLFFLLIMLFIVACSGEQEKVALNLEKIKTIAFSDNVKLDTFKIITKGQSSKNLLLIFTITTYNGKVVFKQEIKAKNLLDSYLASADLKNEAEKEKFIKEEVEFFLNDDHFLEPAVTENEETDRNTPDLAFYEELKQTQLNGFYYRLGKDKKYYIAWSAKAQRVKIYYQCC